MALPQEEFERELAEANTAELATKLVAKVWREYSGFSPIKEPKRTAEQFKQALSKALGLVQTFPEALTLYKSYHDSEDVCGTEDAALFAKMVSLAQTHEDLAGLCGYLVTTDDNVWSNRAQYQLIFKRSDELI